MFSQHLALACISFFGSVFGFFVIARINADDCQIIQGCQSALIALAVACFVTCHQLFCPKDSDAVIQLHAHAFRVHVAQLQDRLGQICFGSRGDECKCALAVNLDVNTVKVRKTDQEIVFGIVIVFGFGNLVKCGKQARTQGGLVQRGHAVGNICVFLAQLCLVGVHHLGRQNRHLGTLCGRVFLRHYEIGLSVRLLQQIGRDQQREELTVLQRLVNILRKAFTGGQEFVVPNGNVAVFGILVDQSHQLVGVAAVLFAVA